MIITLLPFLLAAKFESPAGTTWKHGAEVTYLIQSHATTMHSENSSQSNMVFDLRTFLTCQGPLDVLQCFFHDTNIHSSLADVKQSRVIPEHAYDNVWAKKIVQQDTIRVQFNKNGIKEVLVPVTVDPAGRMMIAMLGSLLDVGLDLSTKLTGDFQTNVTTAVCGSKFLVTRSPVLDHQRSSDFNLFLIPQPNESLARPLEIAQTVETDNCEKNYMLSFFTYLGMRRWKENETTAKTSSAEKFTVISDTNFTSFSKIKVLVNNHKDNTKYIVDESISISLQRVGPVQCENENSSSQEDCSVEEEHTVSG